MLAVLGVTLAAAAAAVTDVTRGRISNFLVVALLAFGLTLRVHEGAAAVAVSILIGASVLAAGTIIFSLGLIGGGDVKFITAATMALGWPDAFAFVLYTVLAGGVLGIAVALARGKLRAVGRSVWASALPFFAGIRPAAPHSTAGKMPYALAILAGAVTLALGNISALHLRIPL